ncbi:hypothetical protein K3495_g10883 [Podosphaera aphanis]|nr:hypothetical protein K3495_g10883 [Podosphaera aphanis]
MASHRKSQPDYPTVSSISTTFDFNCINDNLNESLFPHNVLPLGKNPQISGEWGGTPPYDTNLYSAPPNWKPPSAKIDNQPPQNFSSMSSLTPAEQEKLQRIAMPHRNRYYTHHSPRSTERYVSHSTSPDSKDQIRKRKSLAEDEEDEDEDSNPPAKKTAHNMIEKRYRTNLNDKIAALRDSVPSLRIMTKSARGEDTIDDREELQGLTPAHKLNKATVLSKATEYIYHLEKRNRRLQQENNEVKERLAAFETLFRSSSMNLHQSPPINNPFHLSTDYSMPGTPPLIDQQGMLQVIDKAPRLQNINQSQIYQNPQEIYSQSSQQPMGPGPTGWNNHPYIGKLMVGTLAGLMVLEGFSEAEHDTQSPAGRGLFALPANMLRSFRFYSHSSLNIRALGYHISGPEAFWYLKIMVIFSAILYAFLPHTFYLRPRINGGKIQGTSLAAAPSLASPIQVRRQAWLTAIQTVWVPKHNFFLEAAALCIKMVKLSMRNVIGSQGYTYLTGITEQQETARIKAWTIALDAQLAGGDVEINKSRLTLTLLASETLPDTPARLMLKALHIRVLLWEIGNSGFHGYQVLQEFAARLARWKWNKAKQLQQLTVYQKDEQDRLPDYLIALLNENCDDVLVDSISQRAYNLTWNLPTMNNTCVTTDFMDAVIDDFTIRSPLDAVAAWFSCHVLQRALSKNLEMEDTPASQKLVINDIDLAIRTAPFGSIPHIHALIARSILVKQGRADSISEAIKVIGPLDKQTGKKKPSSFFVNTSSPIATLPEVKLSLRCAIAIANIERCPAPVYPEKASRIIGSISTRNLTLLGFTATFKLMEKLLGHDLIATTCVNSLERLAGSLRIWIGGKDGEKSGLSIEVKKKTVQRCLAVTKRIVGMQDAGYVSMS